MANTNQNNERNQGMDNRDKSGQKNPGNFKNDPERAAEAGRKGGESSQGNRSK